VVDTVDSPSCDRHWLSSAIAAAGVGSAIADCVTARLATAASAKIAASALIAMRIARLTTTMLYGGSSVMWLDDSLSSLRFREAARVRPRDARPPKLIWLQ
jgi:hypothetical protein